MAKDTPDRLLRKARASPYPTNLKGQGPLRSAGGPEDAVVGVADLSTASDAARGDVNSTVDGSNGVMMNQVRLSCP